MATASSDQSASSAAIQALMSHMPETAQTASRPLSMGELMYAISRRGGGTGDPSTIVSLACSTGHTITDDEVVLACAALRLRHPLLASRLALVGGAAPHFTVEFHALDGEQDAAARALRDAWLACDPDGALDVRERTCALWWGRRTAAADPRAGEYVFGLVTTHFVTDNRRRLNLVRQFLELLASPGRASAELDAYFSAKDRPKPVIPVPTEQLLPKLSGDAEESLQAKAAYDELVTRYADEPVSGIVADGSVQAPLRAGIVRKVWSAAETARILRACKVHGVTITHLANVAGALASVRSATLPGSAENAPSASPSPAAYYCFDFVQAIDVPARAGQAEAEMETALRIELYPVVLRVPRAAVTDPERIWALARQFRAQSDAFLGSPWFWHMLPMHAARVVESYKAKLAGRPALPFMSSLGSLKTLLPARYAVQPSGAGAGAGAEIRVTDHWTAGRIDPLALATHLFTFDDRLHLQFRYNVNRTSDSVIVPWFDRLVEIVSRLGSDSVA